MASLVSFLHSLPAGLLVAAALLEIFVIRRRNADGEPGVLWLLFCCAAAASLDAAAAIGCFFWKGGNEILRQGFWSVGLAACASAAWYLKRQGRNRSFLLLSDRFRDSNPANPPRRKPGQVLWIIGYRTTLAVTAAVAFTAMTAGSQWVVPGDEADSGVARNTSASRPATAESSASGEDGDPPAASPSLVDPTKAEIPSAELSAVAAMATSSAMAQPHGAGEGDGSDSKMTGNGEGNPPAAGMAPGVPVVAVSPAAAPAVNSRPVSRNSIYFSKIRPILARSCVSCHGPSKQKGDLRLDTPDAIRAGVNGKPVIVPGNPAKSRLHIVTGLPADDTDRMPPKGTPLNSTERELIAGWIKAGADLGDGVSIPAGSDGVFLVDTIAENLPAPDPKLIETLTAEHVIVRPLSRNGHVIEMDFSHSDRAMGDLNLAQLAPIALNIYALDFSRTAIKDEDLAQLAPMKNLSRLMLSRTRITDTGLAHLKTNAALEQLNLYNTPVTDTGLNALSNLKSLKKIYLWKSQATPTGAKTLEGQVPGLVVSMGE